MTVRPLRKEDIPKLQAMADVSGFPYVDLDNPHIESAEVVVDSHDMPIFALVTKRLVEGYGYFDKSRHPAVLMAALKLADREMGGPLREKMYTSLEVFIPPQIAEDFGRRLERTFKWVKNWPSWCRRF